MQTDIQTAATQPLTMEQLQYQHALRVLEQVRGNKLRAAKLLGISRMTLYRLLGRHMSSPAAKCTVFEHSGPARSGPVC